MSSTYTTETLHGLLRHAVAPTFEDRRAADQMLFSLRTVSEEGTNTTLLSLLGEATDRFGDQLPAFLTDLAQFWMDACAQSETIRMARFTRGPQPAWSPPAHAPTFAMTDTATFTEWDFFGLGIGLYLEGQAQRLGFLTPLLTRGLTHPASTVSDACWKILARHPQAAAMTFPAMWAIAREKGAWFAPEQPMRGLAAIVEAHPPAIDALITTFAAPDSDNEIQVASAVTTHLTSVPPALVDAIESCYARARAAERRAALFVTLMRIASQATHEQRRRWLADAQKMVASSEESLRAAAAWAFVSLDDPGAHEKTLLALLDDSDWWPRRDACAALGQWLSPSPAIVGAVARRLGDYDGYDGEPHESALQTLRGWKGASASALPTIAAWLERTAGDSGELRAEALIGLLDALGETAHVLHSQIARLVSTWDRVEDSDDEEPADEVDPEQQFNVVWDAVIDNFSAGLNVPADVAVQLKAHEGLQQEFRDALGGGDDEVVTSVVDMNAFATRIGIDVNEDIPGTRSSAELAAEPDAAARVRAWLLTATQA